MPKLYSVCGYHPTDGDLGYAAYKYFTDRTAAELWARTAPLPLWSLTNITEHNATETEVAEVAERGFA